MTQRGLGEHEQDELLSLSPEFVELTAEELKHLEPGEHGPAPPSTSPAEQHGEDGNDDIDDAAKLQCLEDRALLRAKLQENIRSSGDNKSQMSQESQEGGENGETCEMDETEGCADGGFAPPDPEMLQATNPLPEERSSECAVLSLLYL